MAKEFHLSQRKVSNFAQANQTLKILTRLFISWHWHLRAEPFAMLSSWRINWWTKRYKALQWIWNIAAYFTPSRARSFTYEPWYTSCHVWIIASLPEVKRGGKGHPWATWTRLEGHQKRYCRWLARDCPPEDWTERKMAPLRGDLKQICNKYIINYCRPIFLCRSWHKHRRENNPTVGVREIVRGWRLVNTFK